MPADADEVKTVIPQCIDVFSKPLRCIRMDKDGMILNALHISLIG